VGVYGGVAVGVACYNQADTYALGLGGQGRQQRPAFKAGAIEAALDGCEMIEEPGMFEHRILVGF
jgi:hypothetical protein